MGWTSDFGQTQRNEEHHEKSDFLLCCCYCLRFRSKRKPLRNGLRLALACTALSVPSSRSASRSV